MIPPLAPDVAPDDGEPPYDRDLLAAEWVLGVLDGGDRAEAARLLASDDGFADAVARWEARLAPLASRAVPAEPPAMLWSRIAARLPADPVSQRRSPAPMRPGSAVARGWRLATGASLALAAALAGFIVLRGGRVPVAVGPDRLAVLVPPGGPAVFVVDAAGSVLRVRPVGGIQVAEGRDLELWVLREGAARPDSLGVLPAAGRVVPAAPPAGAQILVSLEPRGGSPTGQPTGPVVYAGRLALPD